MIPDQRSHSHSMLIYNTLSSQKEVLKKKRLKMFVCGPTVYGPTHLGHAKTVLTFDIIVKYLRSIGYNVFYLQNITDIDDKIIRRAAENKTTVKNLARAYRDEYFRIVKLLNITAVDKYAPATRFIPQIVKQIKTLIKKSYAYKISDGYYFNIVKFTEYGKLAKRTIAQADDGVSRIDENEEKINRGDFCLWKFKKPGEPFWKSPLGDGRPGWHIEDTAITEHFFGPQYDLHGGGADLIFPHHEAEIAQQEAASGKKPFVRFWLHVGLVLKNGRKMSKSLGNFETAESFIQKHGPLVFRVITASHHYRSTLDITDSVIAQSRSFIAASKTILAKLSYLTGNSPSGKKVSLGVRTLLSHYSKSFADAMSNDFNTPEAFAAIFELINRLEKMIWTLTAKEASLAAATLTGILASLGIELNPKRPPKTIGILAKKRDLLRSKKLFDQADKIRDRINKKGYTVDDTPLGTLIRESW